MFGHGRQGANNDIGAEAKDHLARGDAAHIAGSRGIDFAADNNGSKKFTLENLTVVKRLQSYLIEMLSVIPPAGGVPLAERTAQHLFRLGGREFPVLGMESNDLSSAIRQDKEV